MKQSDGNIWVYSEPGKGTTFKIYLPSTRAEPKARKSMQEHDAMEGRGEMILVVEDEPALRQLFGTMLKRLH